MPKRLSLQDQSTEFLLYYDDIVANDYNLSVSSYVEAEDTREKMDINQIKKELSDICKKKDIVRQKWDKAVLEVEKILGIN